MSDPIWYILICSMTMGALVGNLASGLMCILSRFWNEERP